MPPKITHLAKLSSGAVEALIFSLNTTQQTLNFSKIGAEVSWQQESELAMAGGPSVGLYFSLRLKC